ncbi:MAG: hypothetical protein MUC59_02765 [Saprospiraceae bacterium]|jgi:hypothetical protein|nr:hypothetical protein [Saprospiraceae bacterium]
MRLSTFIVFLFFYFLVLFVLVVNATNTNFVTEEEMTPGYPSYRYWDSTPRTQSTSSIWDSNNSKSWLSGDSYSRPKYSPPYKSAYATGW